MFWTLLKARNCDSSTSLPSSKGIRFDRTRWSSLYFCLCYHSSTVSAKARVVNDAHREDDDDDEREEERMMKSDDFDCATQHDEMIEKNRH